MTKITLLTPEQRSKLNKVLRLIYQAIFWITALAVSGITGYYYNTLTQKKPATFTLVNHNDVRVAIDSEQKLIVMERKTGQTTIYSDSIGRLIFHMYSKEILK
jgi:hypothetical protein